MPMSNTGKSSSSETVNCIFNDTGHYNMLNNRQIKYRAEYKFILLISRYYKIN